MTRGNITGQRFNFSLSSSLPTTPQSAGVLLFFCMKRLQLLVWKSHPFCIKLERLNVKLLRNGLVTAQYSEHVHPLGQCVTTVYGLVDGLRNYALDIFSGTRVVIWK